jgi:hypothetical protein
LNDIFGPKQNQLGDCLRSLILITVSASDVGEQSMTISRERFRDPCGPAHPAADVVRIGGVTVSPFGNPAT